MVPDWIERMDWAEGKVAVKTTRKQIRNSPEYDPSMPVERAYEARLYSHYGRPPYWGEWRDAA